MLLSSPLGTLISVIQSVRLQAVNNADLLKKNEAATRAALIDPILRALGWDTANVRMVEPEHVVANKQKLDYLLKDAAGTVAVVIEAKCLHEQLDKLGHVGAAIGYAFSLKPRRLFITDGLQWHYYSPAHSQFHPMETINLQEADAATAALELVGWLDAAQFGYFSQLQPGYPLPAPPLREPAVAEAAAAKSRARAPKVGKPTKAEAVPDGFVPLTQVNTLQLQPGQKPTQLRLPDGTVQPVKTWKDVLVRACEFVLENRPDLSIPFPDRAGKKTKLFAHQPFPAGIGSFKTQYRGQPLFIYTNYSADACLANAQYILGYMPEHQKQQALAVKL
ncbi:hypothetical protein EJV47_01605 [Hymenobacter gummosus]|uniref:Type I restriction enzyme R protein N-terminal domain-containing protein n=1 Tax=Hymenobacter gummosus TaxID=1776032 RepID=A0A3S0HRG7_9BACT|nr:hypothetical protein [Hymenobacter gummosus]RTQ53461.1 hypothetical protein EJV47_01605 [Hymenobacter gummosus]